MHATPALAHAMVLAAGRGERMRPLTNHTPKPLLPVRGTSLLEWHLHALARAGLSQVVINTGWLGELIPAALGTSFAVPAKQGEPAHTLALQYSREDLDFGGGIETAGGISRALPLLSDSFWLVAGDVFIPEFCFDDRERQHFAASNALAHLWLVPNPAHNPKGDFIVQDGLAFAAPGKNQSGAAAASPAPSSVATYTYSTIALLKRALFEAPWCDLPPGNPAGVAAPLGPLLFKAAAQGRVSASIYTGPWTDVGTPERLAALNGA